MSASIPIEQVRALIKLLYPEEMTPQAKRQLERALDDWASRPSPDEQPLREAIDDLWSLMRIDEIQQLQESTRTIAKENHELLWHNAR